MGGGTNVQCTCNLPLCFDLPISVGSPPPPSEIFQTRVELKKSFNMYDIHQYVVDIKNFVSFGEKMIVTYFTTFGSTSW